MPKYWWKQIFSLGSFPEVGQKEKTEKKRKQRRAKVGNNNGQLRNSHLVWRTQSRLGQKSNPEANYHDIGLHFVATLLSSTPFL